MKVNVSLVDDGRTVLFVYPKSKAWYSFETEQDAKKAVNMLFMEAVNRHDFEFQKPEMESVTPEAGQTT